MRMYREKLSKLGESSNQVVKSIFASKKNRPLYKSMHSDFLCNDDFIIQHSICLPLL